MIQDEIKHVTTNADIKCDYCGKQSNVYYVLGGVDCEYTIVLCPAHRNYFIEQIFIKIANKKANEQIAEFKKQYQKHLQTIGSDEQ